MTRFNPSLPIYTHPMTRFNPPFHRLLHAATKNQKCILLCGLKIECFRPTTTAIYPLREKFHCHRRWQWIMDSQTALLSLWRPFEISWCLKAYCQSVFDFDRSSWRTLSVYTNNEQKIKCQWGQPILVPLLPSDSIWQGIMDKARKTVGDNR